MYEALCGLSQCPAREKAALRFGNTEASTSDHLLCLSTGATESALPARVLLNSFRLKLTIALK